MRTPGEVQRDVLDELVWDPRVCAAGIRVTVRDGAVRLTGTVGSLPQSIAATAAARRVHGVQQVSNELEVLLALEDERTDAILGSAVDRALQEHAELPAGAVRGTVTDGWVTLEGEVEWGFQHDAATEAVTSLAGVRGVVNRVRVRTRATPPDLEGRIEAALERSAALACRFVRVDTVGGRVLLRGRVRSFDERDAAERIAWSAPGVREVVNHVTVETPILVARD